MKRKLINLTMMLGSLSMLCTACANQHPNQKDVIPVFQVNGEFLMNKYTLVDFGLSFDSYTCNNLIVEINGKLQAQSNFFDENKMYERFNPDVEKFCYIWEINNVSTQDTDRKNIFKSRSISDITLDKKVDFKIVLDLNGIRIVNGDKLTLVFHSPFLCHLLFTYNS